MFVRDNTDAIGRKGLVGRIVGPYIRFQRGFFGIRNLHDWEDALWLQSYRMP
jgi:hypothetical protein